LEGLGIGGFRVWDWRVLIDVHTQARTCTLGSIPTSALTAHECTYTQNGYKNERERERERERGALRHSSFCVFYDFYFRRRNRTGDRVVWSPWRLRRESLLRAIAQALGTAPSSDT
jgi:hypothetical protein